MNIWILASALYYIYVALLSGLKELHGDLAFLGPMYCICIYCENLLLHAEVGPSFEHSL